MEGSQVSLGTGAKEESPPVNDLGRTGGITLGLASFARSEVEPRLYGASILCED
jgi:hypothetical protein